MQLKTWLKSNKVSLGIILGLIIPIPAAFIFLLILRLVQKYLHFFNYIRDADILLLGLAVNLLVMRYYIVKLRHEKTGKALLVLTVLLILLFFIFMKNMSLDLPF
jgi:hypothetical protein